MEAIENVFKSILEPGAYKAMNGLYKDFVESVNCIAIGAHKPI